LQTKGLSDLTWEKDAAEGSLKATFSRFGVVDRDGDVTLPSAFDDGQEVPMVWSHQWEKPVGKGTIRVHKDRATFDGAFFLDTADGLNAYKTVKNLGSLQQYSYGYQPLEAEPGTHEGKAVRFLKKLEDFEVSPVLVGAGRDTRTESIKQVDPDDPEAQISTFADQIDRLLADSVAVSDRAKAISDLRAKEGRPLSEARRRRLSEHRGALAALIESLDELLAETDRTPKDEPKSDPVLRALLVEAQRIQTRYGVPLLGDRADG